MASGSDSPVTTISSDSPSEPQAKGTASSRLEPVENTIKVLLPLPLADAYDYRVPEGMPVALVVIDTCEERNQPMVLINPEITWMYEERVKGEEGCLSVPGIYDGVERATQVKVTAMDRDGQSRTIEAEGMLAICIQHEMDHLVGKVFVEYLSPLKQGRIKTKMVKAQKAGR